MSGPQPDLRAVLIATTAAMNTALSALNAAIERMDVQSAAIATLTSKVELLDSDNKRLFQGLTDQVVKSRNV